MLAILEYEDAEGRRPFGRWFDGLSIEAAVKVETALARLEAGNFSNVRGVGQGVSEIRIHFGPGYRIYFGQADSSTVILLGGGDKSSQAQDIRVAKKRWSEYKQRRRKSEE